MPSSLAPPPQHRVAGGILKIPMCIKARQWRAPPAPVPPHPFRRVSAALRVECEVELPGKRGDIGTLVTRALNDKRRADADAVPELTAALDERGGHRQLAPDGQRRGGR